MEHVLPSSSELAKPRLRGVLHQWSAVVALGAGLVMTLTARPGRPMLAAAIFSVSLVTLFTVSAAYHRPTWRPRARMWMRRADHAAIFVLIAGTYTPLALVALPPSVSTQVLVIAWIGAALGILQSMLWVRAPKFVAALIALALGWSIVPYAHQLRQALSGVELGLVVAGGVLYTLGAVAYATRRPRLWPRVFGYHEVFHAFTIGAAVLHFAFVLSLVH